MRTPILLFGLLALAACWGAEPRPTYEQEFRGLGQETHLAWFGVLQERYGCDTLFVKMDAHPELSNGIPACDAARWVQPEVVRAWRDSTGVREEWEYLGGWNGSGPRDRPWVPRRGRCTLELAGPGTRTLHVTQQVC